MVAGHPSEADVSEEKPASITDKVVAKNDTATDVLMRAMEACSDGNAECVLVVFATRDGEINGWSTNIENPVFGFGLCHLVAQVMFGKSFAEDENE
jgi:hypothetical protein